MIQRDSLTKFWVNFMEKLNEWKEDTQTPLPGQDKEGVDSDEWEQ